MVFHLHPLLLFRSHRLLPFYSYFSKAICVSSLFLPSPLLHLLLCSSSFLPPKVVRGVKNVLIIQAQIHSGPVQDNYRRSNTWSPFSWRSVYTLRCRWLWEYHYYLLVALRLSCKTRCICMKVHGISSCFLFSLVSPFSFFFFFLSFFFLEIELRSLSWVRMYLGLVS